MLEILQFPFMQRALIAGLVLAVMLAYLGIFAVLRRMAFFSGGIAHASLAGVAIGVLAGVYPLYTALLFSVAFALIIYLLEQKAKLPSDTAIGILFSFGMALGVVLMSFKSGYQPELVSFLFGNILAISTADLYLIIPLALALTAIVALKQKKATLLALSPEFAYLSGVNPNIYQPLFYVFLAIAVVLGIKIVGVVLVSALMIVPVSTAKMLTRTFASLIVFTVLFAVVSVASGVAVSYYADLPTGPAIVLVGVALFIGALLWRLVWE